MAEVFRKIQRRDMESYRELLRHGFSEGLGAEDTVDALLRAAKLYRRFFHAWRALALLRLFPTLIPDILVCEQDGEVAAAIAVCRRGYRKGPFYVSHVVADPASRGQGMVKRLIRHYYLTIRDLEGDPYIIAKVRAHNIVPVSALQKRSYWDVFARERRYTLAPELWFPAVTGKTGTSGGVPPQFPGRYVPCLPSRSEMKALKRGETPEKVRRCDPASMFPFARPPGLATLLTNLFLIPVKWRGGAEQDGTLLACGTLSFHRLQGTYELDLSAAPNTTAAVQMLLVQAMEYLLERAPAAVNISVRDDQHSVREALEASPFSLKGTYLWVYRRLGKHHPIVWD
jgi:hypothetical protein